ncbi:unnamed protein product [Ilex paraguariensis]|uniref:Uncharacterized protein n=1 Tax=Ilex paraguariensis TaxID=185542 RepID=A0ABC8SZ26_9AQUA
MPRRTKVLRLHLEHLGIPVDCFFTSICYSSDEHFTIIFDFTTEISCSHIKPAATSWIMSMNYPTREKGQKNQQCDGTDKINFDVNYMKAQPSQLGFTEDRASSFLVELLDVVA